MTTTMVRPALKATGLHILSVGSDGRGAYVDYVAPGIMLLAVAGAAQGTAISVAMDMSEGIIARFRTMGHLSRVDADRTS